MTSKSVPVALSALFALASAACASANLRYWGRGKAVDLAAVRKALDLTAWEGATKAS
jgi:hypothetical protein